ncbi:MAG: hypothetical protein KatS3mg051_1716 [Anaerolineae bacterium]|nr:MAG: hypothetical protein KatS3mg051_1716 [Anaerolineae bacterium]
MSKSLTSDPLNSGVIVAIYPDPAEPDLGLGDLATSDGAQNVTLVGSASVASSGTMFGKITLPGTNTDYAWLQSPLTNPQPFTINVWVTIPDPTTLGRRRPMIWGINQSDDSTNQRIAAFLNEDTNSGRLSFRFMDGTNPGGKAGVQSNVISGGTHMLTCVWNGVSGPPDIYVDGVLNEWSQYGGTPSSNWGGKMVAGADIIGTQLEPLAYDLHALRIYDRALTDAGGCLTSTPRGSRATRRW